MKKAIPTYTDPAKGSIQTDIVGNSNDNFTEIFNKGVNYSKGIQNFLSKLKNQNNQKRTLIKIGVIGDSIAQAWVADSYSIAAYFANRYPSITFEYTNVTYGGTGSDYITSGCLEMINENPDLIIFGEWENYPQAEMAETMLKLIREKTSSDIVLFPFTMSSTDMMFWTNHDMVGWKASNIYQARKWWFSMMQKYNTGMLDIHQPWMRELWNGTETTTTLSLDGLHLKSRAYYYTWETLDLAFIDNYDNDSLAYNYSKIVKTTYFPEVLRIPDVTKIIKSGIWTVTQPTLDKTNWALQSSQVGAYIELTFEGIGLELAYFGANVGSFDILIDGVQPSTLIKDYFKTGGQYLHKVYHVSVNTNVLTNYETVAAPYFVFTSATEYNIKNEAHAIIASGNINADLTFDYKTGNITIPAMYNGITNFRGTFIINDYFDMTCKKNWYNQITQAVDNLTTVTRIFGLNRGTHTLRITHVSGTINLDSIIELK